MARLFFEDPLWLYVVLGGAEGVLLLAWWTRRTRARAVRLLYPVAAGVLVAAVAALVTTDRERIEEATRQIVRAAVARDFDGVERHLDEGFRLVAPEPLGRSEAMRRLRGHVLRYDLGVAEILELAVDVGERRARARLALRLELRGARASVPLLLSLEATWVERANRWRAVEARLVR